MIATVVGCTGNTACLYRCRVVSAVNLGARAVARHSALRRTLYDEPSGECDAHQPATTVRSTALRCAAKLGLNEGICNRFSLAVSDDGREFPVNPQGFHWSELKASDIVLCHCDGRILGGERTVEATAYYIHAPIHAKRPDAKAVLHTHMPYATALALVEGGWLETVE